MKPTTSMTIAALVVATITAGAALPALAQDGGYDNGRQIHFRGPHGDQDRSMHRGGPRDGMRMMGHGARGGLFALVCSENGADRLEHMLLGIAQRTDPTTEQAPLYDALKDAALAAQADFAETCTAAKPAAGDEPERDLAERLKTRLEIEEAHVAAMTAVLPAFEAFYDSLSDEQKSALEPRRHVMMEGMLDGPRGPGEPMRPNLERDS